MLGMGCAFPLRPLAKSASQISAPEWDGLSGLAPRGNCVPVSSLRMGRAFRIALQAETASQISAPNRDALSRRRLWRKLHPGIELQSGTCFPNEAACGNYVPDSNAQDGMPFPIGAWGEKPPISNVQEMGGSSSRAGAFCLERRQHPGIRAIRWSGVERASR